VGLEKGQRAQHPLGRASGLTHSVQDLVDWTDSNQDPSERSDAYFARSVLSQERSRRQFAKEVD
jgi:hypothetical protein